jgi:POT family proton-dependent oligopeptide transporter
MISITCLEFSYTQAPRRMKSFIMSFYLLSVSFGNLIVAGVNVFIQNEDKTSKLAGASYYWFFTALMLVTALIFLIVAKFYREKTYIQEDSTAPEQV